MLLSDIAEYVTERISSEEITLEEYVTTDSLLQNKCGREIANNLPPTQCNLTYFKPGDILVSNIRPYLRKLWKANISGGCSTDVLVFRAKKESLSDFLYTILMQDSFFDFAMKGAKGSKMPRGDKNQLLLFPLKNFPFEEMVLIGKFISNMEYKIQLNRQINHNLEAMAHQIYDYWFVQFDFPNEEGRPYKSSGGEMVWNEKVKREIPAGWGVQSVFEATEVLYGFPFSTELFVDEITNNPVVRIRDILSATSSAYTTENVNEKYRLQRGDVVIGMDGNFHMNFWHTSTEYLNQRCVRLRTKVQNEVSAIQIFHQLQPFIKAKEQNAKGSTVGHLSDNDIKKLWLYIPKATSLFKPKKELETLLQLLFTKRGEIIELTKQRDELLPLLMNGQVSVNYDLSSY